MSAGVKPDGRPKDGSGWNIPRPSELATPTFVARHDRQIAIL
jgi:hypothetical protein